MKTFFHVHKKRIFWADLFQISETTPLDDPVKMTQFPPASLRFKPGDHAVAVGAEAVRLIWRHRESLSAGKLFAFRDPPTRVPPMQAIKWACAAHGLAPTCGGGVWITEKNVACWGRFSVVPETHPTHRAGSHFLSVSERNFAKLIQVIRLPIWHLGGQSTNRWLRLEKFLGLTVGNCRSYFRDGRNSKHLDSLVKSWLNRRCDSTEPHRFLIRRFLSDPSHDLLFDCSRFFLKFLCESWEGQLYADRYPESRSFFNPEDFLEAENLDCFQERFHV